jgi:hypothetical protein
MDPKLSDNNSLKLLQFLPAHHQELSHIAGDRIYDWGLETPSWMA